jgi:hypothetical protein
MKKLVILPVVLAMLSTGIFAEPVKLNQLSAKTKWMVHIDFEKLMGSKVGGFIKNFVSTEKVIKEPVDIFEKSTTVNFTKNVSSITICGRDEKMENAIFYMKGTFNKDQLNEVMRSIPGYSEDYYKSSFLLISWPIQLPGKTAQSAYVYFHNDGTVLLSVNKEIMLDAIKTLNGEAKNFLAVNTPDSINHSAGNIVSAFANDLNGLMQRVKNSYPQSVILRQIQAVKFKVKEMGPNILSSLSFEVNNQQAIVPIEYIFRGIQSLAYLSSQENPKISNAVNNLKIKRNGNMLNIDFLVKESMLSGLLETGMISR